MVEREEQPTSSGKSPFSLEARDEDYDTYLFWPSLSNGIGSFEESLVTTNDKPMSPVFDHVDYYSGWDTAPSSPLSLTPPTDFPPPSPCRDEVLDSGLPEVQHDGMQEKGSFPKYCRTFMMGLLLTRAARHVDRAVQSVAITLRRNKPTGRAAENAHTFDR